MRLTPSKIVCVGRNYVEHAREMGNDVPKEPLIFLKPPSSVIGSGDPIVLPELSRQVEHEGEIGIVVGDTVRLVDALVQFVDLIPAAGGDRAAVRGERVVHVAQPRTGPDRCHAVSQRDVGER